MVADSAEVLADYGVESQIVATKTGEVRSLVRNRDLLDTELPGNIGQIDARLFDLSHPRRLAYSPDLRRYLRGAVGRFDVVHIHSLWLYPQMAAFRESSGHGVPYIVSLHGTLAPQMRGRGRIRKSITSLLWQSEMLRNAAALHLTTDQELRLTSDIAPGVAREVVPVGLHTDRFSPGDPRPFREKYLRGRAGPVVMFLGRVAAVKGIDVLIKAFARTSGNASEATLVVVGPDDEGLVPGLRRLAGTLGVADRVVFTGPLFNEERRAALSAATVWVSASFTENFGVSIVEAMAMGLPTLITPNVNIAKDAESAGATVLARPEPEEFSAKLNQVLLDAELRVSISRRAGAFAHRFDWSEVAPALAEMYTAVSVREPLSTDP